MPVSAREKRSEQTYKPPLSLRVRELLCIGPLVQELVGRVELGRKTPLAKPKRRVTERSVGLHALEVADTDQIRLLVRIGNAL